MFAHICVYLYSLHVGSLNILTLYLVHNEDYHIRMLKKCTVANITLTVAYLMFLWSMQSKQNQHLQQQFDWCTRAVVRHYVHHCADL